MKIFTIACFLYFLNHSVQILRKTAVAIKYVYCVCSGGTGAFSFGGIAVTLSLYLRIFHSVRIDNMYLTTITKSLGICKQVPYSLHLIIVGTAEKTQFALTGHWQKSL